jgi:hypothetical protein
MALGSFVEKHGDAVYFGHDGLAEGFVAVMRASETRGQGAVVMANGFGATPLALEILRSIAVEYAWEGWLEQPVNTIRLEPSELSQRIGRYGTSPDDAVFITPRDGKLSARRPFEQPVELLAVAKDTCVGRDGTRYIFATDGSLALQSRGAQPSSLRRLATPTHLELVELGRGKEAIALYQMLPSSHGALDEARFDELGMDVAWQQLDAPKAVALYEVATALHAQSLRLHIGLADAYARAGRRQEARAGYARAKGLVYLASALSDHDELYVRARFAWLEQRGLGRD